MVQRSLKPSEKPPHFSQPGPAFALLVFLHLLPSPQTSFNPNKFLKSCVCVCVCFWYIRTDHVCASLREYSLLLASFLIYVGSEKS